MIFTTTVIDEIWDNEKVIWEYMIEVFENQEDEPYETHYFISQKHNNDQVLIDWKRSMMILEGKSYYDIN